MRRLLIISIPILPFLMVGSCEYDDPPQLGCFVFYVITYDFPCAILSYKVTNTGNCTIYVVDIDYDIVMGAGTAYIETVTYGTVEEGVSSVYQNIEICNEGHMEVLDHTYEITDW